MITFVVWGSPVAQPRQRHRVVRTKSGAVFATNYIPKNDPVQSWKDYVRLAARSAGATVLLGPLTMTVEFFLPRPANLCRNKDPDGIIPHSGAKDIDNLFKSCADALIGICYQDDRQVAQLYVAKWYHEKDGAPRAKIMISELT